MADIECKFTKEEIFLLLDCVQETIWLHNTLDLVYRNLVYFKDIDDKRLREIRDYLNRIILVKDLHRIEYKDLLKGE